MINLKSALVTHAAAAIVAASLSAWATYEIMDMRLDAEKAKREKAEGDRDTARGDLSMCQGSVARQNAAVEALQKQAAERRGDYLVAEQARIDAEAEVARILSTRTPAGVNRCEAARSMVADELRRERGQ